MSPQRNAGAGASVKTGCCMHAAGRPVVGANAKILIALIAASMTGACSRMEDQQMSVGRVTYRFPAEHVFRFTKPTEGHPFARIRTPGKKFDLIYSEFSRYRRNWQGDDVPRVTGINDRSASGYNKHTFPGGLTVCREGQPYYSCGLSIEDEGVNWSVIFHQDQINNSEAIRAEAKIVLRGYRVE